MRSWLILLGGLLVWAAQFFTLYILASVFGSSATARIGAGLVTILCLAADAALLLLAMRLYKDAGSDEFQRWVGSIGALGAALSLVAVVWQGSPALLS